MARLFWVTALLTMGLLSGCGSSIKSTTAMDSSAKQQISSSKLVVDTIDDGKFNIPDHIQARLKSYLKNELAKRDLLAEEGASNANRIQIKVTYYRMRGGVARDILGVLAGKDGIQADVLILPPDSDKPLHTITASSFNFTAAGTEEEMPRLFAGVVAKEIDKQLHR